MAKRTKRVSPASTPRFKKQKINKGLEDWISRLPDEILVSILSLLTMKEAASTSVLSSQWTKLWTSIPALNFDGQNTLDDIIEERKKLEPERVKYTSWVNQVVKSYQGPTVDEFRIHFNLDKSWSSDIDRWINFAFEKKVKKLEVNLSDDYFCVHKNDRYCFPHKYIEIKKLRSRNIGFPSCSINSLTALRLDYVNITGEVMDYFLSNCHNLETLYVGHSARLVNLKVAGPLLKLKYLEIENCYPVKNIEISAPNLLSFKYSGEPKIRVLPLIKHAPKLVELLIQGVSGDYIVHNICELSRYLNQIEKLTLDSSWGTEDAMHALEVPLLTNLKQLKLRVFVINEVNTFLGISSLIEIAPFMERLILKLVVDDDFYMLETEELQQPKRCSHQHLKVMEISDFLGTTAEVDLVLYLIENVIMLEKIIFDTRDPILIETGLKFEVSREQRRAMRCAKKLGAELYPRVTSVIL